ncbi:transporter [Klebsiella pneumoniae subsp. ozaenae]|uniref:Transporter n=1 Tax=Klebsiella pneumoniae subsp. ozaenae TaxID=574 RepID=A0A378B1J8_KLEPO|nr:transporter [Klebsiella pneumoniae subsp. ozaenae]
MSTSVSTTQLNLRIISIVVFTCICYLSIGLPLAVLPGYIHYQLGYSTFVAGIVISLQYISTLISRPHAGRYTDIWGPKKVVSLGIVCCLLSGAFTLLAVVLQATPMLAIATLLAGRVFLGVGESFTATGATLWGIKTVGAIHTSRVISWNGVATYVAMAVGAPLGVTLNHYFGISGFATVVVLVAAIGLLFARTRQDVKVTAGARAPFHAGGAKNLALRPGGWPLAPSVSALSPPLSPSTSPRTAGRAPRLPFRCSASALSAFAWCWEIPLPALAESRSPWPASSSKVSACCLSGWRHQHGWPASAPFSPVRVSRWSFRL